MNLMDRYLGKTILQAVLVVLLAIIGIEMFILLVAELQSIGHNHYTIWSALYFVLLNLPAQIYQLFPMIGLVSVLMGLGLLANHSELIIFQSAGASPLRIAFSTLKTILLLLVFMGILGEFIAPKSSHYANYFKSSHMQNSSGHDDALAYDVWVKIKNAYIHINNIGHNHVLYGLSWYQFDEKNRLVLSASAQEAHYVNQHWIANNIEETDLNTNKITTRRIAQKTLPLAMAPEFVLDTTQDPNNMSLSELDHSLTLHAQNHSINTAAELAYWHRLLQPLASLVMMLLALPFIFGPLRQAKHSLRLVIGISVGFCFYYTNQLFGPMVLLFHWPAFVGAALPTILFGALGIIMLTLKRS